jgi:glycosyltransferase involved in cell wall biosynthesis
MQSRNGISRDSKSILEVLTKDTRFEIEPFEFAKNQILRGLFATKIVMNGHPKLINFGHDYVYIPQLQGYLPHVSETAIIRLHDIYPFTNPEWFKKISVRVFKQTLINAVKGKHLFVCNSFTTQQELLEHFPTALTKVIYCSTEIPESKSCGECDYCERIDVFAGISYFLTVGTIEPRKNYDFLLSVWKKFNANEVPTLIIVGRRGWKSFKVYQRLKRNNDNVIYLNNVCDAGVKDLTKNCMAYISVSLGEGFNYPAMDAAKFSKPLILSDISIHRELYANLPLYVNPNDETSLFNAITNFDSTRYKMEKRDRQTEDGYEENISNLFIGRSKTGL